MNYQATLPWNNPDFGHFEDHSGLFNNNGEQHFFPACSEWPLTYPLIYENPPILQPPLPSVLHFAPEWIPNIAYHDPTPIHSQQGSYFSASQYTLPQTETFAAAPLQSFEAIQPEDWHMYSNIPQSITPVVDASAGSTIHNFLPSSQSEADKRSSSIFTQERNRSAARKSRDKREKVGREQLAQAERLTNRYRPLRDENTRLRAELGNLRLRSFSSLHQQCLDGQCKNYPLPWHLNAVPNHRCLRQTLPPSGPDLLTRYESIDRAANEDLWSKVEKLRGHLLDELNGIRSARQQFAIRATVSSGHSENGNAQVTVSDNFQATHPPAFESNFMLPLEQDRRSAETPLHSGTTPFATALVPRFSQIVPQIYSSAEAAAMPRPPNPSTAAVPTTMRQDSRPDDMWLPVQYQPQEFMDAGDWIESEVDWSSGSKRVSRTQPMVEEFSESFFLLDAEK